jgi:PKD repeat protein
MNTNNSQYPSNQYQSSGTYTVKLTVTNTCGAQDSEIKYSYINVDKTCPIPAANFSSNPRDGDSPLEVYFFDASTAGTGETISNLEWDFGNGKTSSQSNPVYTYNNSGRYTVQLTVTNSCGEQDTRIEENYISVNLPCPTPSANFSSNTEQGVAPLSVRFFDQSLSGTGEYVINQLWTFGDGITSTEDNPNHIYQNPGIYTVSLNISNSCGQQDTERKVNLIVVENAPEENSLHTFFNEAGDEFNIPSNLLKAIADVESGWNQAAHNGNDWGIMQLNESGLLNISQRLKNEFPEDYAHMSDQSVVDLLKEDSFEGANANIRGAASKLRWDATHVNGLIYDGEPVEALEVWWFVLAYYNGGGGDNSLQTSNYPFRVYNRFIRGVIDDNDNDGVRVPQIPITLPPHITFELASQNELNNYEISANDHELISGTPAPVIDSSTHRVTKGFIRKVLPFNACEDLGHLHDNDGNEIVRNDCQPNEFTLDFPLEGYNAYNAPLNAIFDYSSPNYDEDDYVIDYMGEIGEKQFGYSYGGYKQENTNAFVVNGNYTAAGLGREYLFYDGHPGNDYRTTPRYGADILATASGIFHIQGGTYNIAFIDHGNGYATYYYHCRSYESELDDQQVEAGDLIGESGDIDSPGSPHLHLEIRKNDIPVDPYGWQANENLWTKAVNAELWGGGTGGANPNIPLNLETTATGDEIHLKWEPPYQLIPDSYNIYRDDEMIESLPATQFSFIDSEVDKQIRYTYCVTSVKDNKESPRSNLSSETIENSRLKIIIVGRPLLKLKVKNWKVFIFMKSL